MTASDYLARLWRQTLISDLLWVREDGLSSISATPEHAKTGGQYGRTPSWSWASMNGRIMHLSLPDWRVLDTVPVQSCATLKPGVENPSGRVVSGHIDLVCPYMMLWGQVVQKTGKLCSSFRCIRWIHQLNCGGLSSRDDRIGDKYAHQAAIPASQLVAWN